MKENRFGNCENSLGLVVAYPMYDYRTDDVKAVVDHLRSCKKCQAGYDALSFKMRRPFDVATEKMQYRVYTRPALESMLQK